MTDEHKKHQTPPGPEKAESHARTTHDAQADALAQNPTPADAKKPEAELTKQVWDKAKNAQPWSTTSKGRFAIRTFSRGVMGAAFFTAGGLWAKELMLSEGNIKEGFEASKNYMASRSFTEQKNFLQVIAKSIDEFAGKPIAAVVDGLGGNGANAVHFKPTKYVRLHEGEKIFGRSLGEEAVMITFDFFMASIGDAMGRDIIGWFDPSIKKNWMDEHGHIKPTEAVKSLGKTAFRYLTYNGGEDWAVAIPYAFFIKGQRKLIDKYVTPGYRFESDLSLNKGALKVNTLTDPHTVVGSYSIEAMMDYQSRFTIYNMGTLMYRELYDKVDHMLHGEHVNLYGAPDAHKDKTPLSRVEDFAKWVARDVIKGAIFMTPAVPFFSITRVTQNRDLGMFIDPKTNSVLSFKDAKGYHVVSPHDVRNGIGATENVFYSNFNRANPAKGPLGYNTVNNQVYAPSVGNPVIAHKDFNTYQPRHNFIENLFSKVGRASERASHMLDGVDTALEKFAPRYSAGLKRILAVPVGANGRRQSLTRFTQPMIHASISYTPYMYMKAEAANLWDNGKTDLGIERMVDGASQFNWHEFKAGVGEVRDAVLRRPFEDQARETEARRRSRIDTSAGDTSLVDPSDQFKIDEKLGKAYTKPVAATKPTTPAKQELSWRDRLVKGRDENKDLVSTKHAPQSHTEREEMRKMLEEVQPPTNSLH